MIKRFETILLEEAFKFIQRQDHKTRSKILQNIRRAEIHTDPKLFKKLSEEILEFRTKFNGVQYRLLAFWVKQKVSKNSDLTKQTVVFATHGIVKKTSKVEKKEIKKAENIRANYFEQNKLI